MRVYARTLHVAEYFLFDPFSGVLEGYELDAVHGRYLPKTPDAHGRVTCEQLGLLLGKVASTHYGTHAEWLRWLRPSGEVLPMPEEALDAERDRANAERDRAERLTAELAALKALRHEP